MREIDLRAFFELEGHRSQRSGRPFTVVRLAPPMRAAGERELHLLRMLVQTELRRTDLVQVMGGEVVAFLAETAGAQVLPPLGRVQGALSRGLLDFEPRVAWASVGPGHRGSWQEAWRWAGALLVAEPAAA